MLVCLSLYKLLIVSWFFKPPPGLHGNALCILDCLLQRVSIEHIWRCTQTHGGQRLADSGEIVPLSTSFFLHNTKHDMVAVVVWLYPTYQIQKGAREQRPDGYGSHHVHPASGSRGTHVECNPSLCPVLPHCCQVCKAVCLSLDWNKLQDMVVTFSHLQPHACSCE